MPNSSPVLEFEPTAPALVEPDDWDDWVSAGRLRNFLRGDPLLDWLERYGEAAGFQRDDQLPGFDERTDFLTFLFEQGSHFEDGVLRLIGERYPITTIATEVGEHSRSLEHATATVEAMRAGAPFIAQAVLWNPDTRTYGVADLLVRSDMVNRLVPGSLDEGEASVPAPGLGSNPWHYRVVDVKFHSFDIDADRRAMARDALTQMSQVWLYNEALGRLQGYTPPAAFLLGRNWRSRDARGSGCFERLARVDRDAVGRRRRDPATGEWTETPIAAMIADGLAWIRGLRTDGAAWHVLPEPSVPELYPHAKNQRDAPWHAAKTRITAELQELTMLPAMNPELRRAAHAAGIRRWTDPRASAVVLSVWDKYAASCDAVLAANRGDGPVVVPDRIAGDEAEWRTPAGLELFVDFETTSDLADDFSALPAVGGQPLIFQIGAGHWEDGEWRFAQWTVDRLTEADEAKMIDAFVAHVHEVRRARGLGLRDVRLIHWSAHETLTFETAYSSARNRHGRTDWPDLPWYDFLSLVVRPAAIGVRGAFSNSLKPLTKGLHAAGLIETTWGDGPVDGMAAMVGAWWCDAEAARTGGSMRDLELMAGIERYNEVDCRAMAEIVRWLRVNR